MSNRVDEHFNRHLSTVAKLILRTGNSFVAGVREFAMDNADWLTLVEETEGGGQLCYSHTAKVLDLICHGD